VHAFHTDERRDGGKHIRSAAALTGATYAGMEN